MQENWIVETGWQVPRIEATGNISLRRPRPAQGCKLMMIYYSRPVHHNYHLTPVLIPDWYNTKLCISAQWAIIKSNSTE